jgi:exonuclease III
MKGLFWNSRGLSDLAKYRYISDAVRDNDLDFVAVMETGKQDMSKSNLARLSGGADFVWHCLPPKGRSGGLLLGVRDSTLELSLIVEVEFYIKFHLCNKSDKFSWILMAIYGPAQDDHKAAFLTELVRAGQQNTLPTLMGGDFNILRNSKEKNNDRYCDRWPFLFNAVIDSFDLREIEMSGRQFTWANSLPTPTYEKLDRVLMSSEWEFKYPMVSIQALDRGVSDHTPLLLDTGSPAFKGKSKKFKLELCWLSCEEFNKKVVEIWNGPTKGRNSVQRWNSKMSALRRCLRGWATNYSGQYKQKKADIQGTIIDLDVAAEVRDLSEVEQNLLAESKDQLAKLLREEEIRFYQRAKTKDILLGDSNTRYFHMIANGKNRKKRIFSLDHDQGKIEGQENLTKYITSFYKELFGAPPVNDF